MAEGGRPVAARRGGQPKSPPGVWQSVALVALVALVGMAALGLGAVAVAATPRAAHAVTIGVSDAAMQAAVNAAGWPQHQSNWCGVASIAAVASYVNNGGVSQESVAGFLNSTTAESIWGTPPPAYGGAGFPANISRDTGTDPRAIARGLGGMDGGLYHNIVDSWGAYDTTFHIAVDLRDSHQPITVIVSGGEHSVVVSAIFANDDPVANPGSIYAIEVWDPGVGVNAGVQAQQKEIVNIWDWYNDGGYLGWVYSNPYDPDPSVGVYAGKRLWSGNWVYIRPWGLGYVSADWAMDQWGQPIPGLHGEYPPGYTPPTPTPTPTPTATPTPLPIRLARAAPTALATAARSPQQSVEALADASPTATAVTAASADLPLAPPAVETPDPPRGWCAGPYCVASADLPWWGASLGCVLLLAGLWGAIFARARRADAKPATGPPRE